MDALAKDEQLKRHVGAVQSCSVSNSHSLFAHEDQASSWAPLKNKQPADITFVFPFSSAAQAVGGSLANVWSFLIISCFTSKTERTRTFYSDWKLTSIKFSYVGSSIRGVNIDASKTENLLKATCIVF